MAVDKREKFKRMHNRAGGGAIYGLGFVGALVYYLQHAATFSAGVVGFLKALVWPAILIYKVLGLLKL
jgi:uncharacterized protein YqhQ